MEPWHARSNTRLWSPNKGWAWSWSFKEFISSQPVIKTKTAPGLSFLTMWQSTCSIRLKPIESGHQQDNESWVRRLYPLKSATSKASYEKSQRSEQNKPKLKDLKWKGEIFCLYLYLNSRSNLALSFSESLRLFLHFPCFFLTIIINLIIRCQPMSSSFQNILKKMCSNWKCKTLECARVPKWTKGKQVYHISHII